MDLTRLRLLSQNPAKSLDIGKAAEHLVCADLILSGYRCFLSDQGLPYDLCVDVDGRLLRVQVKSTCFPRNINANGRNPTLGYSFHVRQRGKNGGRRLDDAMCDVVAMVALDINVIVYQLVSRCGQTCQFRCPTSPFSGKYKMTNPIRPMAPNSFADVIAELL